MNLREKLRNSKLGRSKNTIPVDELDPVKCENCGHEFKGHFCPNCGQKVAEFNRPIGFVIYDFVGNFFAFDTRFFRTFKYLLFRPGFLTKEFFQGRRMRYSPPFRIFVFLSFILFLLLQVITERSLDYTPDQKKSEASVEVLSDHKPEIMKEHDLIDTVRQALATEMDTTRSLNLSLGDSVNSGFKLDLDEAFFTKGELRDKLDKLAEILEERLKKTDDREKQRKLKSYIAMCRNPGMVISSLMKYLSWSFFILLPLFALILKFFYIRRNQNYIKHLIFSIHLHSYLFFILIIITGLRLIFSSELLLVNSILIFSIPIYFIWALRFFYGQNIIKVFLKFMGISIIYNVVLWSTVLFVFLKTLNFV